MVGMIIGLAVIATWGTVRFTGLAGNAPLTNEGVDQISLDGLTVFQGFFFLASIVALVGVIPAWFMSNKNADI